MLSASSGSNGLRPADIWIARKRLERRVLRTPLLFSPSLSRLARCEVHLKMECWQLHGCFKVRGATNMVAALSEEERARGLVTCSSGNHGIALAYAARLFDHAPTKVFLPEDADSNKVTKLKGLGAEAVLHGKHFLEALDAAQQCAREEGAVYVHSHSDPLVIAGQGTIGLEILEDLPDVDVVVTPIGGGGLISGVGTAVKSTDAGVHVVGVEPSAAPGAYMSFRDGYCHERIDLEASIADGLLGTLTPLTWEISRGIVKQVVLVEEKEIIEAMRLLQSEEQLMVEGSAAVGLAALMGGRVEVQDQEKVALILTGRNISAHSYNGLIHATSCLEGNEEEIIRAESR